MRRTQRTVLRGSLSALALSTTALAFAQPAPSGAHPRIWLDSATKSGLEAQAGIANSPVARGAKRCAAARNDPSDYAVGGWQGFEFVTTLSGCLVSYAATGSADDLSTAIKYWTVLLDDYQEVGDGAGGDDVVTHDTGYAMRTFAPYSALAYDWLHDAPGVSESLRAHARARFDAWMSFYSSSGYLRSMPGANYQAGYLFAATLIAVAEGGEAGAAGDAHWATVRDTIWGNDMAGALAPGGVLEGGDWPEGWQYGPLSVLEYSLAARALEENGAPVNGMEQWGSSLVSRFAHGLTPGQKLSFVAGDTDAETANRDPNNGALLAAIAGPASSSAKAWARKLNSELALQNENPLFDAIALASSGPTEAPAADAPTNHLAKGSGNWYVRGGWSDATAWSVFQCSRRLVDDHQHNDAGNFVMTRGDDDLVVDPSPYGTLSTLTGNAPAIDSGAVPSGYSPSQGNWGEKTELVWARQSASGVASARCDYADQFRRDGDSDVPHAVRDYVFIPDGANGSVILVDRVVTGDASRGLHLRVRTPGDLALSGSTATATMGSSALAVERVFSNNGAPNVRAMPQASECPSSDHKCDVSRLPEGTEYRLDVAGPSAFAIHVVSGRAADSAAVTSQSLEGEGFRGVIHGSGASAVAVITNGTPDGALGSSLVYAVPAGSGLAHVVLDAPVNADGKSNVTAVREGANCRIEVTPANGSGTSFDAQPLVVRTSSDCALSDDGTRSPATPGNPGGEETPGTDPEQGNAGSAAVGEGGAGDADPDEGKGGTRASNGSGGTKAQTSGSAASSSAGSSAVLPSEPGTGTGGSLGDIPEGQTTPPLSGCSAAPEGGRHNPFGSLAAALVGLAFVTRQRRLSAKRKAQTN